MWKGKRKFIVIGLIAVMVLAGSIAGVAYAQTGTNTSANNTLMDRVAAILKIEPQTLKDAFAQAQKEQQEQRLTDYLNKLVTDGKMTQPQADQYKQWWQSRPNIQLPKGQPFGMRGFQGRGGRMGGHNFRGAPNAPGTGTTPQ